MLRPVSLLLAFLLSLVGCPTTPDGPGSPPAPTTVVAACDATCDAYAECGCDERCASWCESYLEWTVCEEEIDALVRCAATHPSPCTWNDEPWEGSTCQDEVTAFGSCSGNDFFPLPGAPGVCE
ncbi:MAG: hypothetical protein KDA24_25550 [Deltaproteobacteria bacterium]|nr:hypothetical protein [Deltaproteobacteria bacterium]